MITDNIGVSIISFNRPYYLRRTLASLEQQTHLEGLDFHLFQDGAVNKFSGERHATSKNIAASVAAFDDADLPRKTAHIHEENVGTGINQFSALEYMVSNYEYIVMLENDVILSPHWMRLTRVLFEQIKDRGDIFSFSLGFRRWCPEEEITQNLNKVRYGNPHWWGEAIVSERWARARPHFLEYYELIKDIDYRLRDNVAIWKLYEDKGWRRAATSQDGGREMAVWAAGMRRVCAVVNRGVSIGAMGVHFRPWEFWEMGFDDQEPYIFEEDANLEAFAGECFG